MRILRVRVTNKSLAVLPLVVLLGLSLAACSSSSGTFAPYAVPTTAPVAAGDFSAQGKPGSIVGPAATPAIGNAAPADTNPALIIKTGQLTLQVSNPEAASAQATGIVGTVGGYVSGSSRSGDADMLSISVTYRIPVAKWDSTLDAIHHASGGGTLKILGEQIQTEDVTASAVDMDARLANLRATEQSLLAIMARATTITDTLAVQTQLTTVQGQIEELQAQRNKLGDQAAYSTLNVVFAATPKTETTSATSGWTINGSIDDATATLVKIGQSVASAAVWLIIVGLPVGAGLFVLYLFYRLYRRIRPRQPGQPRTALW
jgi:hypothetical protein